MSLLQAALITSPKTQSWVMGIKGSAVPPLLLLGGHRLGYGGDFHAIKRGGNGRGNTCEKKGAKLCTARPRMSLKVTGRVLPKVRRGCKIARSQLQAQKS